jgi:tetratricopeptide (TPR) repeat protein
MWSSNHRRFGIARAAIAIAAIVCIARPAGAQIWERLSNPKVKVSITNPPGLGLKVTRIAFGPSRGEQSDQFVDAIVQDFVQSNIEVVDRAHLESMLAEHKLSSSGLLDRRTTVTLGKLLGPAALVFINVQRSATEKKSLYQDDPPNRRGVRNRRYISRTQAYFKASVQTVDLATGRVFQATSLEFSPKGENVTVNQCCAEFPSEFAVMDEAVRMAVSSVHRLFVPWTEERSVYFFDDGDCALKSAHALLKSGDVDGAFSRSQENLAACKNNPAAKKKTLAHAYHNLGIAYFLKGQYEAALGQFSEAQRLEPSGITSDAGSEVQNARSVAQALQRVDERPAIGAPSGASAFRGSDPSESNASSPAAGSAEERLRKLEDLYRKKLITKPEYDKKRAQILGDM